MLTYSFIKRVHIIILYFLLALAIVALAAELLPEVKAKMIVIPTLTAMIGLSILELRRLYKSKD